MKKDLLTLALALTLVACSGESAESPVHAAGGGETPAAKSEPGASMLDQAKDLASQANVADAQKMFETQLAAVGTQIEKLKSEAAATTGSTKASATQLADKLGDRYTEAKKRYEAWKAEGGGDLTTLANELQPLLKGVQTDLAAALKQVGGK